MGNGRSNTGRTICSTVTRAAPRCWRNSIASFNQEKDMTRLSELPMEQWDPELRKAFDDAGIDPAEKQYKASAVLAHAPHMAKANMAFMGAAYQGNKLSRRLLELVRLRLAFHNQCRSCMAMRFQAAVDDGLSEDLVASLE